MRSDIRERQLEGEGITATWIVWVAVSNESICLEMADYIAGWLKA